MINYTQPDYNPSEEAPQVAEKFIEEKWQDTNSKSSNKKKRGKKQSSIIYDPYSDTSVDVNKPKKEVKPVVIKKIPETLNGPLTR